jgi:hypothetical protein
MLYHNLRDLCVCWLESGVVDAADCESDDADDDVEGADVFGGVCLSHSSRDGYIFLQLAGDNSTLHCEPN